MRNTVVLALLIVIACGNDKVPGAGGIDAPPGDDAGDDIDAPLVTNLDCNSYCGAIQTICTGALAQYDSVADCLGACEHLTVGTLGDDTGNSLACRVYHTDFARADATTHCEHAGPGGGSMCGATSCDGFCSIAPIVCPGEWQAGNCAAQCGGLTSVPPYAAGATGDTIECRLYHLTRATTDATTHCPHTDRQNSALCQ